MNLALIISDNPEIEKSLSIFLKESFIFDTSKEQPLEEAINQPLDLLFLDIPLKGKEPFSLLKKIQSLKPDLPIIVLIPELISNSNAEALKTKVYDILSKPPKKERLRMLIEDIVKNRIKVF